MNGFNMVKKVYLKKEIWRLVLVFFGVSVGREIFIYKESIFLGIKGFKLIRVDKVFWSCDLKC